MIETHLRLRLSLTWGMSGNHQTLPHIQATCTRRDHREGECGGKALLAWIWKRKSQNERGLLLKTDFQVFCNTNTVAGLWAYKMSQKMLVSPVKLVSTSLRVHVVVVFSQTNIDFNLGLCGMSVPPWSLLDLLLKEGTRVVKANESICNYLVPLSHAALHFDQDC